MEKVELFIDDLILDVDNPRIDRADSQREALQQIIDGQGDKLLNLAKDIVDWGLSPLESLMVEKRGREGYVALEGNRRVAALKLLSNPALRHSVNIPSQIAKEFEKIAQKFDPSSVEPIPACEIDGDRETARRWIELRHTGANEGRGVVDWGGVASAKFRGESRALEVLEFVKKHGNLNAEETQLAGSLKFPITTLQRLLDSPSVRQLIGLQINEGNLSSGLAVQELIKPLRKIVLDLATKKVKVGRLMTSAQQVSYINEFAKPHKPNLTEVGETKPLSALVPGQSSAAKKRGKAVRIPSDRHTLAPARLNLNINESKIAEIFRELRTLTVDGSKPTPHAAAVLFRVFLELSVDGFLTSNGRSTTTQAANARPVDKKLGVKISEAIDLAVQQGANRKDFNSVARAVSVPTSPLSVDLLHGYVHNRFQTPIARDLIVAWDNAQPFFEWIWK